MNQLWLEMVKITFSTIFNLTNINRINLNAQAIHDKQGITKSFVDQFHQGNERTRRDLGTDFYNESSNSVKNNEDYIFNYNDLTNLNSSTFNRNPSSDNELAKEIYRRIIRRR